MKLIMAYITYPNVEEARKIVTGLLEKKLIACANIFPVESFFWWGGKIEHADEVVSIIKTRKEHWETLKSMVGELHSYEVPCITKFEGEANNAFGAWICSETS